MGQRMKCLVVRIPVANERTLDNARQHLHDWLFSRGAPGTYTDGPPEFEFSELTPAHRAELRAAGFETGGDDWPDPIAGYGDDWPDSIAGYGRAVRTPVAKPFGSPDFWRDLADMSVTE